MLSINLKERKIKKLSEVEVTTTFKIVESSNIFMKIDADGFTVRPIATDENPEPKPIKVLVPEGKETVLCMNTGRTQFLNSREEVQIVILVVDEVYPKEEKKETETKS